MKKCSGLLTVIFTMLAFAASLKAGEPDSSTPRILLNGQPAEVTVQDLSGFGTRPLRLLVNRNNKARGEGFLRVYALGVSDGDLLTAELAVKTAGVRATVYRIFRETDGGPRYLSMPSSNYFPEPKTGEFHERVESAGEEFLVFVFEKTDAAGEKNIQVRYFEERVRKLVIAAFKTNLTFSSLKLKMKDFGGDETAHFFERDAQLLIDRMTAPQEILLFRLWKKKAVEPAAGNR